MMHWLNILTKYGLPAPLTDYSSSGSLDKKLDFNETLGALRIATNGSHFNHSIRTGRFGVTKETYIMRHRLAIEFMMYNIMKKHCV